MIEAERVSSAARAVDRVVTPSASGQGPEDRALPRVPHRRVEPLRGRRRPLSLRARRYARRPRPSAARHPHLHRVEAAVGRAAAGRAAPCRSTTIARPVGRRIASSATSRCCRASRPIAPARRRAASLEIAHRSAEPPDRVSPKRRLTAVAGRVRRKTRFASSSMHGCATNERSARQSHGATMPASPGASIGPMIAPAMFRFIRTENVTLIVCPTFSLAGSKFLGRTYTLPSASVMVLALASMARIAPVASAAYAYVVTASATMATKASPGDSRVARSPLVPLGRTPAPASPALRRTRRRRGSGYPPRSNRRGSQETTRFGFAVRPR